MGKYWRRRISSFRKSGVFSLIGLLLVAAPLPVSGQQRGISQFSPRSEDELLLLAIRVGDDILSESFPAFPADHGLLVPIGELSRLLSLAIDVDVSNGTADGFFIAENRRFHLNVREGSASAAGRQVSLDPRSVEVHQDDIYLDTRVLSQLLPLDFTIDLYGALITIRPREPLPMQLRSRREQEVAQSLANLGFSGDRFPLTQVPYRLFDVPFVDQTLELFSSPRSAGGQQTGLRYATLAAADLLGAEASLFLSGQSGDALQDVRGSLRRRDPDAGLLGILHAREVGAGEIFYPGVSLISLPRSGPGVLLSNYPLDRQNQFDSHSFEGDLPPGWEVELYRNDALLGYQQSRPDGRYRFDNVPVLFGLNVFRLVFYGPQGEKREERQLFNVGDTLAPPGRTYYLVSANRPEDALARGSVQLDYGISRSLTMTAGSTRLEVNPGQYRNYEDIGLRGYWKRLFAFASYVRQQDGGYVAESGLQTRVGSLGLSYRHAQLHDYESEIFRPIIGPLTARDALRLDGILPLWGGTGVPLLVEATRDQFESGGAQYTLSALASAFFRGTAISNRLNYFLFEGRPPPGSNTGFGSILLSKYVRQRAIRGEINYRVAPSVEFSSVNLKYEWPEFSNYIFGAGLIQSFDDDATHYIATVDKNQGAFGLGAIADLLPGTGLTLSIRFITGIKREPRSGRFVSEARGSSFSGAASARVFFDTNGNGVYDAGEKPVQGVGFFVNQASSTAVTDINGVAFIDGLPSYQHTEITIAQSTLEDPLWIPKKTGYAIVPRAGRTVELEFPVLITGEVTGTAFIREEASPREFAGMQLQLVDESGQIVKETRTAYDGFYDLVGVTPGRYLLRGDPRQMLKRQLVFEPRAIVIAPDGTILEGVDVIFAKEGVP